MPSHNDPIWMQKFSYSSCSFDERVEPLLQPVVYISELRRSEGDVLTFNHLKTKRSSLYNNSLRDYNNFIMSNCQIDYSRSFVADFRFKNVHFCCVYLVAAMFVC